MAKLKEKNTAPEYLTAFFVKFTFKCAIAFRFITEANLCFQFLLVVSPRNRSFN